MRYFSLLGIFLLAACGKTPTHLADLPPTGTNGGDVKVVGFGLNSECENVDGKKVCYHVDRLGSRLTFTVSENGNTVRSEPWGGTPSALIYSALGGPSRGYEIVKYNEVTLGIHHSGGVSIFYGGKFCKSFAINPNQTLKYGVDYIGNPVFSSEGIETRADRHVAGWRMYYIDEMCGIQDRVPKTAPPMRKNRSYLGDIVLGLFMLLFNLKQIGC